VAVGAVIIIVAAIVYSKRRSAGMGEEAPASAEIGAATSPAVSAEAPDAVEAPPTVTMPQVSATPPVPPAGDAGQNGHVASGVPKEPDSTSGE